MNYAETILLVLIDCGFLARSMDRRRSSTKKALAFEHVHAIAIDASGQSLLLGTHAGLFHSSDGGRSWKQVPISTKHAHLDVMDVVPDPRDPKTIYIGTHEAGVFKSGDGGATWNRVNNGLGGLDVHGLAIDPNAPSKLHAAIREKGRWCLSHDEPSHEDEQKAAQDIRKMLGDSLDEKIE
jgi:photosystem II stability/assembly factor-like uncharacterized protein